VAQRVARRQRQRRVACAAKAERQAPLRPCIAEGNALAPPFHWTTTSVANVMADAGSAAAYNWTSSSMELY
jgi:hypothetical protein